MNSSGRNALPEPSGHTHHVSAAAGLCLLCATPLDSSCAEESFRCCTRCNLLQRDPEHHLSLADEASFYQTHQNDAADPRYRAFLQRLVAPLQSCLRPGARGLDFGCGPAPALVQLMNEAGFPTAPYDPLFAPSESLLARQYDFVACSEVAEHFRDPAASWHLLVSLLKPGGVLGVMTEWYRGQTPIASWRYARDPTHVVFYTRDTFKFIAQRYGLGLEFPAENIAILRAPAAAASPRHLGTPPEASRSSSSTPDLPRAMRNTT